MTGTHIDTEEESKDNKIKILRVRVPKIDRHVKTTIDYSQLDRTVHSKVEVVASIPHKTEVLKCREDPFAEDSVSAVIASLHSDGEVGLYKVGHGNVGNLEGLSEETFALNWNRQRQGLLVSAAGGSLCVWDVAKHANGGNLLLKELAHGANASGEVWQVNDAKFNPLRGDLVITSAEDGRYMIWDLRQVGDECALSGQAGVGGTNACTFSNVNADLFALGGKNFQQQDCVSIWDMRMPSQGLNEILFHEG